MKREIGFTLVELVMVIAIVGILAAIAIPRFVDLSGEAKIASVKANLGAVRSVLAIKYAQGALTGTGTPGYPVISGSDFADGQFPKNVLQTITAGSVIALAAAPTGTAPTHTGAGFWYISGSSTIAGRAGAYSNGSVDVSNF